jgi:hypothetical protein
VAETTAQTFERYRPRIEQIASAKYDAGDFDRDDGDQAIIVVKTAKLTPG